MAYGFMFVASLYNSTDLFIWVSGARYILYWYAQFKHSLMVSGGREIGWHAVLPFSE